MKNSLNKDNKKFRLFSKLEVLFSMKGLLNEIPRKYLSKFMFVFLLGLLYVANSHLYDRSVRMLNKIQNDVDILRADYTMLKAEYMFDSKRSEVAKRLKPHGIKIANSPPFVLDNK